MPLNAIPNFALFLHLEVWSDVWGLRDSYFLLDRTNSSGVTCDRELKRFAPLLLFLPFYHPRLQLWPLWLAFSSYLDCPLYLHSELITT